MINNLSDILGKYIINPSDVMDCSVEIKEQLQKEQLQKRIKFETSEGINELVKDLNLQVKEENKEIDIVEKFAQFLWEHEYLMMSQSDVKEAISIYFTKL